MAEHATDEPRSNWMVAGVLAIGLLGAAIGGAFAWAVFFSGSDPDPETHTFVVEAGTGDRLARGEQVDLMPTEVRMAVGDTLVIRNDDDRTYLVGPYIVRAGEELSQTYQSPQVLIGECSLASSGQIQIVVT